MLALRYCRPRLRPDSIAPMSDLGASQWQLRAGKIHPLRINILAAQETGLGRLSLVNSFHSCCCCRRLLSKVFVDRSILSFIIFIATQNRRWPSTDHRFLISR
jgi:hypothetical protein